MSVDVSSLNKMAIGRSTRSSPPDGYRCGYVKRLATGETALIQSPFFPNNYDDKTQCRWKIDLENPSHTYLQFTCSNFNLAKEYNLKYCNPFTDFLRIKEDNEMERWYCGSDKPARFDAKRMIEITFWSNAGMTDRGFRCEVEAIRGKGTTATNVGGPTVSVTVAPTATSTTAANTTATTNTTATVNTTVTVNTTATVNTTTTAPKCRCGLRQGKKRKKRGFRIPINKSGKNSFRIVGGEEAKVHEFPWVALLEYNDPFIRCSGAIINDQYILTAAHCLNRVHPKAVIIGEHDHTRFSDTSKTSSHQIKETIIHPSFNDTTKDSDIALLRISPIIDFEAVYPDIAPVCAPEDTSKTFVGKESTVAGWGYLNANASTGTSVLHKVDLTILSNVACQGRLSQAGNLVLTDNMICASKPNKDACINDSGGPLVVEEDGKYVIVGIVSWGYGCATLPGVYTRMTRFMKWIEDLQVDGITCY